MTILSQTDFHKVINNNSLSRKLASEETRFQGNSFSRKLVFKETRFQGNSLSRKLAFKETRFQGNSLSRKLAFKETRFQGNSLSRKNAFKENRFRGNSLLRKLAIENALQIRLYYYYVRTEIKQHNKEHLYSTFIGTKQLSKMTVFNDQAYVQVGGHWNENLRRVERPFRGILAGVVYNGLRPLDLAASKDPTAKLEGDVRLVNNIPFDYRNQHPELFTKDAIKLMIDKIYENGRTADLSGGTGTDI
jgi:hypothetical protein